MSKIGAIGKAILEHYPDGFFSLDKITKVTGFPRKLVTDTLVILSQEGVIKKIIKQRKQHSPGHSPRFSLTYRVTNKKALAARITPRLKEDTAQDRLWFIIRKKRFFELRDLIVLAGIKRETARWYLKALRKLGVIQASRTGGGPGVEWTLINDIGPKRPYIEIRKKGGARGMREGVSAQIGGAEKRISIKFRVSKEEDAMLRRGASRLNLSVSAYVSMLICKDAGYMVG
jgi:hypothetical protein